GICKIHFGEATADCSNHAGLRQIYDVRTTITSDRDVRHVNATRNSSFRNGHRVVNRPRAIYDAVAARRRTRAYGIHMAICSIRCREGKARADHNPWTRDLTDLQATRRSGVIRKGRNSFKADVAWHHRDRRGLLRESPRIQFINLSEGAIRIGGDIFDSNADLRRLINSDDTG